jgi:ribonuclease P protein component
VLHLLEPTDAEAPLRVGLVVSRTVGPAVVRNLVKRRLRHLLRERLCALPGSLPSSGVLVVRALPSAGAASYSSLGAELDRQLGRLVAR